MKYAVAFVLGGFAALIIRSAFAHDVPMVPVVCPVCPVCPSLVTPEAQKAVDEARVKIQEATKANSVYGPKD